MNLPRVSRAPRGVREWYTTDASDDNLRGVWLKWERNVRDGRKPMREREHLLYVVTRTFPGRSGPNPKPIGWFSIVETERVKRAPSRSTADDIDYRQRLVSGLVDLTTGALRMDDDALRRGGIAGVMLAQKMIARLRVLRAEEAARHAEWDWLMGVTPEDE